MNEKGYGLSADAIFNYLKTGQFCYDDFSDIMGEKDKEEFENAMVLLYDHNCAMDPAVQRSVSTMRQPMEQEMGWMDPKGQHSLQFDQQRAMYGINVNQRNSTFSIGSQRGQYLVNLKRQRDPSEYNNFRNPNLLPGGQNSIQNSMLYPSRQVTNEQAFPYDFHNKRVLKADQKQSSSLLAMQRYSNQPLIRENSQFNSLFQRNTL